MLVGKSTKSVNSGFRHFVKSVIGSNFPVLNWWHIHFKTNMAAPSAARENETSKLYSIVSLWAVILRKEQIYLCPEIKNILTCTLSLLGMQWKGNWQKNAELWHWKETRQLTATSYARVVNSGSDNYSHFSDDIFFEDAKECDQPVED